jgi:hypothetical protein
MSHPCARSADDPFWYLPLALAFWLRKTGCGRGTIKMRILGIVAVSRAMKFVTTFLGFLIFAGCATKYQEMGFSGGVAAQQITADTFRIVARGNAYTGSTTVQDYVLLKAAETTKAAGATMDYHLLHATRKQHGASRFVL